MKLKKEKKKLHSDYFPVKRKLDPWFYSKNTASSQKMLTLFIKKNLYISYLFFIHLFPDTDNHIETAPHAVDRLVLNI